MPGEDSKLLETIVEAFNHSADGIAVASKDLELLFCNKAFIEIHELSQGEDYSGRNLREIEEPELQWVIDEGMEAVFEKGFYAREVESKRKDGSPQYVHVLANFIPHTDPPLILIMLHDITELVLSKEEIKQQHDHLEVLVEERTEDLTSANKQLRAKIDQCLRAEEALLESETKYRVLAEHLQEGIIVAKDNPMRIVFTNQAMSNIMGYGIEEIRTLSTENIVKLVHPDDRGFFFQRFRERLAGKNPEPHYEFRGIGKDGSVVWLAIFSTRIEFQNEPAVLATFRDITERKRAEEALMESEEKLRVQFKSVPVPMYTWQMIGDDFILREYNDAADAITKGKIADYVGITAEELHGDHPKIIEEMKRCFRDKTTIEREFKYRFKSTGEVKNLIVKYAYVHPDIVMVHTEDITARVQAEEALRRYRDQLEELVAKRTDELQKTNVKLQKEIEERKRAEYELANRNRELRFLNEIYEIVTSADSRNEVLDRMLDPMIGYSEAPIAGVFDVDEATREIVLIKAVGVPDEVSSAWRRISFDSESVQFLLSCEGIYIPEQDLPDAKRTSRKVRDTLGIERTISVPIRFREKVQTVVFLALKRAVDISDEERGTFEIVGRQLGLALERLQLKDELEEREKDLLKLAAQLTESIEGERRRMALQLHDGLSQLLVRINMEFDIVKNRVDTEDPQLVEALRMIDETLQKITQGTRQISYELHPSVLTDFGLIAALERYAEEYKKAGILNIDIEAIGFDERLQPRIDTALYSIAQEAITNVAKHAEASNVSIKITKGYPRVIMVIEDDGKGFDAEGSTARTRGLGIVSMRERAGFLGGDFRIQSTPGRGTRIRVTVPLEVDNGSRH